MDQFHNCKSIISRQNNYVDKLTFLNVRCSLINNPAFTYLISPAFLQPFVVDKTDIISNYKNEKNVISKIAQLAKYPPLRRVAGFRNKNFLISISVLSLLYYNNALHD